MNRRRSAAVEWFSLDAMTVLVFAAIGRRSHNEGSGLSAIVTTALPFLIAVAAVWVAARAWRNPIDLRIGLTVAAGTLAGGMVLRRWVFDDGTAASFIVVAAVFLAATMLGWRVLASRLGRRASAPGLSRSEQDS